MDKMFRKELLRTDIVTRNLNDISQKYKALFLKDLDSNIIKTEVVTQCQCGSDMLEQLTNVDRFGLPFGSLICQDCGLVLTSPRIKEESLPYYYDEYYHPLNYGKENLENQTVLFADGQGKKIFNILKEYLPEKKEISILEIGAGTGNVLAEFKEEASNFSYVVDELGTEYSDDCIEICKSNNINIIKGNLGTVTQKQRKFDVIILSHVFEHFIDLKKELANLKKLMTDDTLLYIEVPGIMVNHKESYYDFSFLGYLIHAHIYNFTLDSLNNILAMNNFKMLCGNEKVETVFKIGSSNNIINSYENINNYLNQYYLAYDFLHHAIESKVEKQSVQIKTRNEEINQFKDIIEKQKIRIQTRDKEIVKFTEMIEKKNMRINTRDKEIIKKDKEINTLKAIIKKQILVTKSFIHTANPLKKYKAYKNLLEVVNDEKS